MICKKCGNEIAKDQNFCTHCGYSKHDNVFGNENLELQVLIKCAIIFSVIAVIFMFLK